MNLKIIRLTARNGIFSTLSAFLDDLTKRNAPGFDYSAFERGARYFNTRQSSSRQLRSQVYTGSVGAENFTYFVAHPAGSGPSWQRF